MTEKCMRDTPARDAWTEYCKAFRDLFPTKGVRIELSEVALDEFQNRIRRAMASDGPFKVGEPEDDDGFTTVLNPAGEAMGSDEIVAALNALATRSEMAQPTRESIIEDCANACFYAGGGSKAIEAIRDLKGKEKKDA